ncbi:MAG: hypothetical protein RIQ59_1025 [Bacteroidota bacterium]|jgi:hypothetical protein
MKKFNINKIIVAIAIFLISSSAFSQDIGFGDDVQDNAPVAPIDSNIYLVLFIGIVYAYFIINTRKRKLENKVN